MTAQPIFFGYDDDISVYGTITSSSELPDGADDNVATWRQSEYWRPAASTAHWLEVDLGTSRAVNFAAMYSQDLHEYDGAQFQVVYGATPAPATQYGIKTITKPGAQIFAKTFNTNARYWRFRINTTNASTPRIEIMALGLSTPITGAQIGPGFADPRFRPRNLPRFAWPAADFATGRPVLPKPFDFSLAFRGIDPDQRGQIRPLLLHLAKYPSFVWPLPESDTDADGAMLAWSRGQPALPAFDGLLLDFDLQLRGML